MAPASGTSRAWRVRRLGSPVEALSLEPRRARDPGPAEVQVRVQAVGLNHPDLLLCAGRYQERPDLPFSPGYEAAGTVLEVGVGSARRRGERVIVVPELPEGAMQETLTVPDAQTYLVPESMPVTTAAVLHIAYTTAHAALHRRAHLTTGETLLVTGGAGGVGSATIQLGKAAGAYVVAVATGARKTEACRKFGADAAIDLATEDLVTRVSELTRECGADVVVDVVGGEMFQQLRRCVSFEGRVVTVGFTGGAVPTTPVNHVLLRNYSILGLHLALYRREHPELLRRIHTELIDLERQGRIAPAVTELPFDRAPAALGLLAGREVTGRVVLRC